jgi:hypothetical protein
LESAGRLGPAFSFGVFIQGVTEPEIKPMFLGVVQEFFISRD